MPRSLPSLALSPLTPIRNTGSSVVVVVASTVNVVPCTIRLPVIVMSLPTVTSFFTIKSPASFTSNNALLSATSAAPPSVFAKIPN